MSPPPDRILVLAYGNPGRLDDGLGPALADRLTELDLPGVTVESDLQLQLEDATAIAQHDVVVFVDATVSGPAPFTFRPVEPGGSPSFTTHSVSPAALLALAREHFEAQSVGWVLAVRGYAFDGFGEGLTREATRNLDDAARFLVESLEKRRFEEVARGPTVAPTV
jgi:hydrogenase maturation protease